MQGEKQYVSRPLQGGDIIAKLMSHSISHFFLEVAYDVELKWLTVKVVLVWLLFNVSVNNFSVMLGRSHHFLGI